MEKNTKQEYIEKIIAKHGDKFCFDDSIYINSDTAFSVKCKECLHIFDIYPYTLLRTKRGCPKCYRKKKTDKALEEFLIKAREVHKDKYNYDVSNIEFVSSQKVKIECPKHSWFEQRSRTHLYGNGCPQCHTSKGELSIKYWLTDNNIPFETQKTFPGCILKCLLRFDFYIPCLNLALEFDGINHERHQVGDKKSFRRTQKSDRIKDKFCVKNNINLLRIHYKNLTDVNDILDDVFCRSGIGQEFRPFPHCGIIHRDSPPPKKMKPGEACIGRAYSLEHRENISRAMKEAWRIQKEKGIFKPSKNFLYLKGSKKVPIRQFSLDGNFIKEYPSLADAAREVGVSRAAIRSNAKGERKSCRGFSWKYAEKEIS